LNQEDLALASIFELGTLGTETRPGADPGQVSLLAYFAERPGLEDELRRALGAGAEVERTPVPDVDWLARFRGFSLCAGGFGSPP
jgi:hypothetical protein